MELLKGYLELIERIPLSAVNGGVSDGLRYHVLDIWVDELDAVDEKRESPVEVIMGPVEKLRKEGKGKMARERAKECAGDQRLMDWRDSSMKDQGKRVESGGDDDDEWNGLED